MVIVVFPKKFYLHYSDFNKYFLAITVVLLSLSVFSDCAKNLDFIEFILGPKIGYYHHQDDGLQDIAAAEDLVKNNSYQFEAHEVTTEDGYILSLHRIPYENDSKNMKESSKDDNRPAALFVPGLLAASDTWLFRGKDLDLPYILADAGYDVWICNMRGNFYSRKHKTLNPDLDTEYWKFSLHEIGYYDLPAIIDYILNVTKERKLFILGHSVGSSVVFILSSLRPEYNAKIKLHLALAPLVNVLHEKTLVQKLMTALVPRIAEMAEMQDVLNVLPRRSYFSKMIELPCRDGMPTQKFCLATAFALIGTDYELFNSSYLPLVSRYYPAGTSLYIMNHAYQLYNEGVFRPLDYSDDGKTNMMKYNVTKPDLYNMSLATHRVSLHYGLGDLLVTDEDMEYLKKMLPNCIGMFPVPFKQFNHMDFMWGTTAKELLYNKLIVIMNKYRIT